MSVSGIRRFIASQGQALPARAFRTVFAVLAFALLALPASALAQDAGATLEPQSATDGAINVAAGTDVPLAVVRRDAGVGVAGKDVDWSVEGPDGARFTPDRSVTTNATDPEGAGIARTRFRAREAGHYTVTASSQTNPGCLGEDCAQFVRTTFEIDVAGAVAESDSSGRSWVGAAAVLAGAVALMSGGGDGGGDDDDDGGSGNGSGQLLTPQGGNGQSALPFRPLPVMLTVLATNDGAPAANVTINWTATNGAVLNATTTTTSFAGLAGVVVFSVGPSPGPVTITATRADNGASVTFTATVLTPQIQQVSGNGQSAPTDTSLPAPLVVRTLLSGVVQAGITINWSVTSGDATIASVANGGVTDASGNNSATIDLGPTPGPITISACRADFPTVCTVFTANSTLTRTLSMVSGDGQTAPPNAPLALPLVVNAQNNGAPAGGVQINWSATGGATLSAASSITAAASGDAQITVTSTGPGPAPIQVFAVRADDPTATVIFTANIVPPTMSLIAGDGQSGLINSAAAIPLEIQLQDGASQPVVGEVISWQVISGTATLASFSSVTDGAGHATMTFNFGSTPGPVTIRASAYGGAQFVDFSATNQAPGGGGAGGGDGQSGAPGSTLPTPLTVTITGPGPDLSGVQVTWTVISGSVTSLSPTVSFTDAAGNASTTVTLGLTPGPVVIQASIQGDGTVLFNLNVTGTLVGTTLTAVSGNGQTLPTGQASGPMVVELKDGTTPLNGMTILWSTDNGSIVGSTVTGANGQTSNNVTPSTGGPVNVTAHFAGFAAYTASTTGFVHNATIASTPSLSTDEVAVAEALDSACAALQLPGTLTPEEQDLLDQCLALNAAAPVAIAEALEEMLPDVAEAQAKTGQAAVNAQFDNLKGRMAALRSGATGANLGGLTLVGSGGSVSLFGLMQALMQDEAAPADEGAGFSRWGLFASGSIGRGETEADDNVPSYDYDINGITVGVDYRKTDSLVIGAALGYSRQDTELDGDQGSVAMRGLSISGYASWYLKDSWYVDGSVTLGRNRYDNERRIVYVLPGEVVDTEANAEFDGTDRSLSISFGRDFAKGAWGGGVWGRMLYSRLGYDEFEEDVEAGNGMGLGLRVESRSTTALATVLGGRLTYTHSADWGILLPTAQLEWQKEHRSDPELFRAFLIDDPTATPILVTGEPLDSSYFRVGVGLSLVLTGGRSGFVLYEKMLGRDGMEMDNLTLGFRMEF